MDNEPDKSSVESMLDKNAFSLNYIISCAIGIMAGITIGGAIFFRDPPLRAVFKDVNRDNIEDILTYNKKGRLAQVFIGVRESNGTITHYETNWYNGFMRSWYHRYGDNDYDAVDMMVQKK
jgi:hypothetical protein